MIANDAGNARSMRKNPVVFAGLVHSPEDLREQGTDRDCPAPRSLTGRLERKRATSVDCEYLRAKKLCA